MIPNNARAVRITAAAGTYLARASSTAPSSTRGVPPEPWSPSTAVYNPRAVVPHVASLRQTCVHCGRFSTAAIRRCPGSVSVPVVGAALSRPLDVFGTVGRYPAVYLVSRRPLRGRNRTLWFSPSRRNVARYYRGFPHAIPVPRAGRRRLTTPFAAAPGSEEPFAARLACLIHATSVHSEPGSNPSSDSCPARRDGEPSAWGVNA